MLNIQPIKDRLAAATPDLSKVDQAVWDWDLWAVLDA